MAASLVAADTHMDALQALLRQPAAAVDSAPATVASCMEAYLPVYAFPATDAWSTHGASDAAVVAPVAKLARIDSMPAVPDYFAEARCDSPPPTGLALPGYGLGVLAAASCGSDEECGSGLNMDVPDMDIHSYSFNDLPLSISGVASSPSSPSSGSAAASGGSSPRVSSPGVVPSMDGCGFEELQQEEEEDAMVTVVPAAGAFHKPAANAIRGGGHQHQHHAPPRRHASDVEFVRLAAARRGAAAAIATATAAATADLAVPRRSLLEQVVMSLWEDRADRGMFRYDVSQCASRLLPGPAGYLAQLNEGRATKKRPTEFSADRVMQPFDPARFHFNKAALGEVLFAFQPDSSSGSSSAAPQLLLPSAPVAKATAALGSSSGSGSSSSSPNLVLINVSPIDHCHVLLVPRVLDCLPQAITPDTALLALQFAAQLGGSSNGSGAFRVGYNSLGAFATINHLHFHAYHLPAALPCERAPTAPLPGALARPLLAAAQQQSRKRGADGGAAANCAGVRVSRLVGYPVRSFVIEAEQQQSAEGGGGASLEAVAAVLGRAAAALQAANQPFNFIASDGGRRVFLFPQCYAERQAAGEVPEELLDTGVNPASFEIAGHLVLKRAADFEVADEAWAARLLSAVSLSEERFWQVADMCFGGAVSGAGGCGSQ